MQRRIAFVLALLACSVSTAAFADFSADFAVVKGGQDNATLSRIELAGQRMRMDSGKISMLVDVGSDRIDMLLHDKHQYMDMGKMAQSLNAMLANVPPQMREMMKQRMAAHGGVQVSYTPTGRSDRIAGYTCAVYRTTINGEHKSDSCLADLADAGISAADQATLRKVFDDLRAMAQTASAGMAKSPLSQMPSGKFPVQITRYDDGKVSQVVQIKTISHASVGRGDFAIPSGYTEMQMPSFGSHH